MKSLGISILLVSAAFSAVAQTFESKRNLIDTETTREGLIYLGVEYRYFSSFVKNFTPTGEAAESIDLSGKSYEQSGFGLGGHLEYFFDSKDIIPVSLVLSAMYQETGLLGYVTERDDADYIAGQSINTELSVAYFVGGSDISITAGIGTGISLGLSSPLEQDAPELDGLDNGVSLYVPLAIRYNYQLFSIDGFFGIYYSPYIIPVLKDSEGQQAYGVAVSIRNPFRWRY